MSLEARIAALAQAVGADIKALQQAGDAPSGPTDLYYGNVALLVDAEGGLVDVSGRNTLSIGGSTAVATDKACYGVKSIRAPGGSYLSVANVGDIMSFGTGDFTVEFNVWVVNHASYGFLMDCRPAAGGGAGHMILDLATNGIVAYGDVTNRITASAPIPTGQWVHVALCRKAGSTRLFFNGVQTGSTHTSDTQSIGTPAGRPFFGASSNSPGAYSTNVYFDNIRITKGIGRYTANFTPPGAAHPSEQSTVKVSPLAVARAWVNFNGNTAAIRSAFNVASVTRNGVGDYTINFATPMADANYAVLCAGRWFAAAGTDVPLIGGQRSNPPTVSAVRVQSVISTTGGTYDCEQVNVAIFGT